MLSTLIFYVYFFFKCEFVCVDLHIGACYSARRRGLRLVFRRGSSPSTAWKPGGYLSLYKMDRNIEIQVNTHKTQIAVYFCILLKNLNYILFGKCVVSVCGWLTLVACLSLTLVPRVRLFHLR